MAVHQATLGFHLDQVGSLLPGINGGDGTKDQILTRMVDLVLQHRNGTAVAQQALPNINFQSLPQHHNDDREQLNADENEEDDDENNNGSGLAQPLPKFLLQYAGKAQHDIIVADLYLEVGQGSMASIQYLVVKAAGFDRYFSISGGYGQQFDHYMRAKECNVDDKRENTESVYIMRHPLNKMYFARVFSFVAAHNLHEAKRYDIDVKTSKNVFIMRADIKHCKFLGDIPKIDGIPIDLAVQQGQSVYGFHLTDNIPNRITCNTVNKEVDIVTTLMKPGKDQRVGISPYLTNKVNFDHVYVGRENLQINRGGRTRRLPGAAGNGPYGSNDDGRQGRPRKRRG